MSYTYRSLDLAKEALHNVKKTIQKEGLPQDLGPLVFTFTGKGNVSEVNHCTSHHCFHDNIAVILGCSRCVRLNATCLHPTFKFKGLL
jgi:hypothetical protein